MQYKPKTNTEAELGVLGALIVDGNPESKNVQKTLLQLHEGLFYNAYHKELYHTIKKRFESQQFFDIALLLGMGISQAQYDLITRCVIGNHFSVAMLEPYIIELQKLYDIRQEMHILGSAMYQCDQERLPDNAQEILTKGIQEASIVPLSRIKKGASFDDIYEDYKNNVFVGSYPVDCGIRQFGVIKNSCMITIAGGSGVGKTFFGLYFMRELIRYQPDKQFLFFSLEMPRNDIWDRYLSLTINKESKEFTEDDRATKLPRGRIFDEPRIDIEYIETIAQTESTRCPISVIVVDYVGLVSSRSKYEREDLRIANITQRLAALAINLNCVVIALTQVNRDSAKRSKDDRCPYPSDVADSVGSVRSSSLWIGIDRPELYDDTPALINKFVVKCRKSRYGQNFEAWFDFNGGRFREASRAYIPACAVKKRSDLDYLNQYIGDM